MNCLEVHRSINRCVLDGLVNPRAIKLSIPEITGLINLTLDAIGQEDIEKLLNLTYNFLNLASADEALVITIGITEELMATNRHLCRWFLDILLRDSSPSLRREMALAFQNEFSPQTDQFVKLN